MSDEKKFNGEYGKSEKENFYIFDTIGVPHPYCIGTHHVNHAHTHFGGMLGKEAIEDGEKYGINCEICLKASHKGGKILKYSEHEQALCVKCLVSPVKNKELHRYLLKIKDEAEKNKYAGFVLVYK